jgi:hypothetical protein
MPEIIIIIIITMGITLVIYNYITKSNSRVNPR